MIGTMFKHSLLRIVCLTAILVAGFGNGASAGDAPDCTPYPGVAYLHGADGTFWGSDFILSNPYDVPISGVAVMTLRGEQSGGSFDYPFHFYLQPRETHVIENPIQTAFPGSNGAAVMCVKMDRDDDGSLFPEVDARLKTYNFDPEDPTKGRFGQTIEAEEWNYEGGVESFVVGDDDERTNVIVVTGPLTTILGIDAYDPTGQRIGASIERILDPNTYYQWSGGVGGRTGAEIFADKNFGPGSMVRYHIDTGSAVGWGSVVNTITGDGYSPRFKIVQRGEAPPPNNEPPYLTCLKHLATNGETCDADVDGDIDHTINISAGGPFPGGPEEFEWQGGDLEHDEFWVEALYGTLPDYGTVDGRNLTMDPEPEDVGATFSTTLRACDDFGCGEQMVVFFQVID